MNLAMRLATGTMLSLALLSVPASARSYRGHGGHYGGHYRHHGGGIGTFGGILLGAAVLGTAAAIASDNRRDRYQPRSASQGYNGYANDAGVYANDPAAYDGEAYDDQAYDDRAYADGAYDDRDRDRAAYDDDRRTAGDPVDDCSRAAERQAQTGGGYARVTGIDRVDEIDGGANVRGRLQLDNGRAPPIRSMSFSCSASNGEVRSLRLG